jgi:hypothetical protein
MTKYLDEYNPTARGINYHAQADSGKLKFNNIRSCIAVVLVPVGSQTMVGVHLTNKSTKDLGELKSAIAELAARRHCKVRRVPCGDVRLPRGDAAREGTEEVADVDVKFEVSGGRMVAYVRQHALFIETKADGTKGRTMKPTWSTATDIPGKPRFLTDRDAKPWITVTFKKLP